MRQYIVILLDDTSVSFCHYPNKEQERRLMPLDTLKASILYAMKETSMCSSSIPIILSLRNMRRR